MSRKRQKSELSSSDKPLSEKTSQNNKKHKASEECAVCLNEMTKGQKIKKLDCGHKFHKTCIDTWIRINKSCPYCREKIITNERILRYVPVGASRNDIMNIALRPPFINTDFEEEIKQFTNDTTQRMIDYQNRTEGKSDFLKVIVFYRDGLNRLKHLKTYSNSELGLTFESNRENLKTAILLRPDVLATECPLFTMPKTAITKSNIEEKLGFSFSDKNSTFTIDKMYFGTPAGIKEDGYAIANYPSDIHADMPYSFRELDRFKTVIEIDDIQFHSFFYLKDAYRQYMHKAKTQILYGSEYHLEFPSLNAALNNPHPIAYIIVELGCGYYNNTVSSRIGTIGRKGGKKTQRNKLQKQNKSRRRRNRSAN
jgi:hypothetical protein